MVFQASLIAPQFALKLPFLASRAPLQILAGTATTNALSRAIHNQRHSISKAVVACLRLEPTKHKCRTKLKTASNKLRARYSRSIQIRETHALRKMKYIVVEFCYFICGQTNENLASCGLALSRATVFKSFAGT